MTLPQIIQKVTAKEPFFTALLTELKPIEDKNVPTLGTDGENLFYNPKFLNSLNDDEACAVVLHETLHCAFQHMWRREKRNQMKWNMATDYAINLIVSESFTLPKDCLLDSKYYGMSAEQIYDKLPEPKKLKVQGWCDKDKWENNKKKQQGQGQGADAQATQAEKDKEAKLKAKWTRAFDRAVKTQYGKAPDSMKRIIQQKYYVPVVDWQNLIANILTEDITDYTFSSPDRRFLEADYVLPDLFSVDKIKDVVFAYDTSGSISQDDLQAFFEETRAIFEGFPTLQGWSAVCDADLHAFKEISKDSPIDRYGFYGGGGTDFRPVFKEITKRDLRVKAMFYFTDTEGEFPRTAPEYPVYWLVKSAIGDTSQYYVPFGTVIKFLPRS